MSAAENPRGAGSAGGSAHDAQGMGGDSGRDGSQSSSDERPLSELLSNLMQDVTALFRKEVELARAEVKQEVSRASKAGSMLGAAAGVAIVAVLLLSWALAWGLAEFLPVWTAFLIVGVVYAVIAGVLYRNGRQKLDDFSPAPDETIETLKEDAQWAKSRVRSETT